ncbi:MAG TPA: hypothetical protein VFA55_01140, partial [Candidatus Kapabacteria bacterium]|nr:hypothetical protein [Candidatus Kapabacteria bacterium]
MKFKLTTLFILAAATLNFYCSTPQQTTKAPTLRQDQVENHPEVTITNTEALNTAADELSPTVSGDSKFLFFTSDRSGGQGGQDIYLAANHDGAWGNITNLGSLINTSDNEGSPSLTPDRQTMYFAMCDHSGGYGDCDIYTAELVGGVWTNVRNLGPSVNTSAWESQPSIAPDGRTLYFASNRPGGHGGKDIWMTVKTGDTTWSTPVDLGDAINTDGDEQCPSIASDGRTMYFSSDGKPGLGGFDIFVSKRKGGKWSDAVNIGTPINTSANELFYNAQINSKRAYFASDRSGGKGGYDIYTAFPNPAQPSATTIVEGVVTDAKSGQPLGASIVITDLTTDDVVAQFRSDDVTGDYLVVLQSGKEYSVTAQAQDHLFYSERFDVPAQQDADQTIKKDIQLQPILGTVRLLVFFDFNKSDLQPASTPELNRALKLMADDAGMKIEVAGFTDNIGS